MDTVTKHFTTLEDAMAEYNGYRFFAAYYDRLPKLIQFSRDPSPAIVFEDLTRDGAQVVTDALNQNLHIDARQVFTKLAHIAKDNARLMPSAGGTQRFFIDRLSRLQGPIETVYKHWVSQHKTVVINGELIIISPSLLEDLTQEVPELGRGLCVPSQGDLHERNLFNEGTIIDFEAAGWNLLATDMATFIWHTLAAGNWFGPRYAQWATDADRRILNSQTPQYGVDASGALEARIAPARADFLRQYFEYYVGSIGNIDKQTMRQTTTAIVFRFLTTFSPPEMSFRDQHITFALANLFFTSFRGSLTDCVALMLER